MALIEREAPVATARGPLIAEQVMQPAGPAEGIDPLPEREGLVSVGPGDGSIWLGMLIRTVLRKIGRAVFGRIAIG